jgi:hypothetical protein
MFKTCWQNQESFLILRQARWDLRLSTDVVFLRAVFEGLEIGFVEMSFWTFRSKLKKTVAKCNSVAKK